MLTVRFKPASGLATAMPIELEGTHTTARVMVEDESLVEQGCMEQIQTLIDHPAFTEPVRIMPDTHWGAGAPIGFTMPLADRIVPNIVGVDVGCGMAATKLGSDFPLADAERERRVREAVPMGRSVHDYNDAPHLIEEFPFGRANDVFEQFDAAFAERFGEHVDPVEFEFTGYDAEYFNSLCDRVLADQRQGMDHVIKSAGTLGGGNHFIEFARGRESGEYWLIVHSGSRYLGMSIAQYWQSTATDRRAIDGIRDQIPDEYTEYLKFDADTVESRDLYTWVTGGMGESYIDKDRLRRELDGSDIEDAFDKLGQLQKAVQQTGDDDDRNTDLDWLEGREAHGYYVDMLFAQQYARWNRELMSDAICAAIGVEPAERFQSVHNYIDFHDLTIRKGATPARDSQRLVVPFNMAEGSVIAVGTGNDEWHQTAPHGAGRVMSRRRAHDIVDMDEFADAMAGVYSESVVEGTRDEAPMAYKSAQRIVEALEPTAEVVEWLDVVHNLKSTD